MPNRAMKETFVVALRPKAFVTASSLTFRIATKFHTTMARAGRDGPERHQVRFRDQAAPSQTAAPSKNAGFGELARGGVSEDEAKVRFPPTRSLSSSDKPLATPLPRLSSENPATQSQTSA